MVRINDQKFGENVQKLSRAMRRVGKYTSACDYCGKIVKRINMVLSADNQFRYCSEKCKKEME